MKVALTGLGADEMFAGYSNFRHVPKMEVFLETTGSPPKIARRPLSASVELFAGKGDRSRKLAELATDHDSNVHPYFLARALFGPAERESLFQRRITMAAHNPSIKLQASVTESEFFDPVNRVSYLESLFYMRNTLLRDSDFMSMAHGLELRVPFLDRSWWKPAFVFRVNRKLEGNSPKSLLLASLGVELPREIVNRPKRGFTFPLSAGFGAR